MAWHGRDARATLENMNTEARLRVRARPTVYSPQPLGAEPLPALAAHGEEHSRQARAGSRAAPRTE